MQMLERQIVYVTLDRKATILYTREFHAIGEFSGNDLATVPFAMIYYILLAFETLFRLQSYLFFVIRQNFALIFKVQMLSCQRIIGIFVHIK